MSIIKLWVSLVKKTPRWDHRLHSIWHSIPLLCILLCSQCNPYGHCLIGFLFWQHLLSLFISSHQTSTYCWKNALLCVDFLDRWKYKSINFFLYLSVLWLCLLLMRLRIFVHIQDVQFQPACECSYARPKHNYVCASLFKQRAPRTCMQKNRGPGSCTKALDVHQVALHEFLQLWMMWRFLRAALRLLVWQLKIHRWKKWRTKGKTTVTLLRFPVYKVN